MPDEVRSPADDAKADRTVPASPPDTPAKTDKRIPGAEGPAPELPGAGPGREGERAAAYIENDA